FVESSNVIGFAVFTLMENQIDSSCMIYYKKPVASIFPIAIDRKRFVMDNIMDTQRYQFFWEMIRSIIVRAIGYHYGQSVGIVIGSYKMVGTGFRCRIGRMRIVGGVFIKKSCFTQSTIYFVGRNMVESFPFKITVPGFARSI